MTATDQAVTWDDLYRWAAEQLAARREARWMVEEASGRPLGQPDGPAPEKARRRLVDMVARRTAGEPLQYVLGSWSFRGLDLMVDRRVLIPRPETEQVVEVALAELDRLAPGRDRLTAVDLGTGSGAIALALAHERRKVDVWAVDASADALAVARANLSGLAGFAATRVRMLLGDWWAALPDQIRGHVDLAVANPPYISTAEMAALDPEVRDWEPSAALEDIDRILSGADEWMSPEGVVVIEMAPHQAPAACEMALRSGFGRVEVQPDLAGRPRALVARR